jgi:hypothetical protein
MSDPIEFHSSYAYAQRPIVITWEDERVQVKMVLSEWRTPEGKYFRIQAEDERIFEVLYNKDIENWQIQEM